MPYNLYYDLSSNIGANTGTYYFTTEDANADVMAPQVVSITPNDNAVDIGISSKVVLSFSESLNSSTVNSNTFSLFANGNRLATTVSRSSDNDTVTLSAALPANSVISVVATDAVTDLSGNSLGDYITLFTTGSGNDTGRPSITVFKPGNGATNVSADRNIILYSSEPLNESTLQTSGALYVSQNGQLITGTSVLSGGGQVITFTPDQPLLAGSYIQVFANSLIQDVSSNALNGYQGSFRVLADVSTSVPNVVARSATNGLPLNPVFDVRFNKPLDPASINATNIKLYNYYSSGERAISMSLSADGKTLRVVPDGLLTASTPYYNLLTNVTDLDGQSGSYRQYYYLATNPVVDDVVPELTLLAPESGLTGVGINTRLITYFSEPFNPITLDATSFIAGTEGSLSIASNNRSFTYTPHDPLPPETLITATVAGVEDYAGLGIATEGTTSFTTGEGIDRIAPGVVSSLPITNQTGFPTNGVISVGFNDVIDQASITFYLIDTTNNTTVPTTRSISEDGRTMTLAPNETLAVGRRYYYRHQVRDLAGNLSSAQNIYFTTSFDADVASPTVLGFNIPDGLTDVPTNPVLRVELSEAINGATANGVKFFKGSEELSISPSINTTRSLVSFRYSQLLDPQTTYTVRVEGIEDTAGNVLSVPVESSFTTGDGTDLVNPVRTVFTPLPNTVVPVNTVLSMRYSERVDAMTARGLIGTRYLRNNTTYVNVALDASLSDDGLLITYTPREPLSPNTPYYFYEDEYRDIASNRMNAGSAYGASFTTSADAIETPLEVDVQVLSDGLTNVPLSVGGMWFHTTVQLDPECVNTTTVRMVETATGIAVAGTVEVHAPDRRYLRFIPAAPLTTNTEYTTILDGVCDVAGNTLATAYSTSFTTGSVTSDTTRPSIIGILPANNATDVSVNSSVTMTFSEAIRGHDIDNVEISVAGTVLAGTYVVNTEQTQVTFTPDNPFPANTQVKVYMPYNLYYDLSSNIGANTGTYYFTTVP